MIADLANHRRFILNNAVAEARHRYAGTAMGMLWHVVQPLALVVLFAFLFGGMFPARFAGNGKTSSLLYIMAGMLPWLAFADCVIRCTTSLTDNAQYLRKLPLPETVFVARTAVSSGLMMLVSLGAVFLVALGTGTMPAWAWLTVPAAGALLIAFAFGIGLIFANSHVFVKDTGQAVGVCVQFWMWLTPIVLTEGMMPSNLRRLQVINPASWFISAIRDPIVSGQVSSPMTGS